MACFAPFSSAVFKSSDVACCLHLAAIDLCAECSITCSCIVLKAVQATQNQFRLTIVSAIWLAPWSAETSVRRRNKSKVFLIHFLVETHHVFSHSHFSGGLSVTKSSLSSSLSSSSSLNHMCAPSHSRNTRMLWHNTPSCWWSILLDHLIESNACQYDKKDWLRE